MYSPKDNHHPKLQPIAIDRLEFEGMIGFPHSEICGSKVAHTSPQLIAACHVLHRLCMPRHPPNALTSRLKTRTTNDSIAAPAVQLSNDILVSMVSALLPRSIREWSPIPFPRHRSKNPFTMSKRNRTAICRSVPKCRSARGRYGKLVASSWR
jgi:hypothetical protein